MKKPNVLMIMTDQFRYDAIGSVNGWMKTPNLDRLCREGTRFSNTYSNSLECVSARFSLATGLYPHQTGIWKNMAVTLQPDFPTWMQAVAAAGYRTSLFGKTHLHRSERDVRQGLPLMHAYGFQTVSETTGPPGNARSLSDMTVEWDRRGIWEAYKAEAENYGGANHYRPRPWPFALDLYYDVFVPQMAKRYLAGLSREGDPWFCWVSFGGPHPPYDTPEPYASMYKPGQIPQPAPRMHDTEDVRGLLTDVFHSHKLSPKLSLDEVLAAKASYAGAITLIDEQIGVLLSAIEARGEIDNTLIIFTSDHGEMDGDQGLFGKANGLDSSAKVPLIVVPPGSTSTKGASTTLVELMDVGATIADYAQASFPAQSNAVSLRPVLEGNKETHRGFAISEFLDHYIVVTSEWKAEFDQDFHPTLLLDRKNDPGELNDLSREPGTKTVKAELRALLNEFVEQTPPRDDVFSQKDRKKKKLAKKKDRRTRKLAKGKKREGRP